MSISSAYEEYLSSNIIKEFLRAGKIPTKSEINKRLEEIIKTNPNLDSPFLTEKIYRIEEYESSSASKINEIAGTLKADLSVAYSSLTKQAVSITNTFDIINSELKSIEKRVSILENKVSNLLLISKNTEGYLDYISDSFTNKEKIDVDNTNTFIDNATGIITLPLIKHTRIPLTLFESDVQFNVVSREQLQSVTLAPGSTKLNAFNDVDNIWSQRVSMARGVGSVTAELIFRLPSCDKISKILLTPASSDDGNITTATIQYSNDGLNWINPDGDSTLKLVGETIFFFSPIQVNYWKIVFSKAGYDQFSGNSYVYEFGLKTIQMYAIEYRVKKNKLKGTLYSKALKSDKGTEFNRISLKVCEKIPPDTSIDFSIAALTAAEKADYDNKIIGINDLNFVPIDPLDRLTKVNATVIDFARLDSFTGINSEHYASDAIDFRYKNNYSRMLDYVLPANIVPEELKVIRNTGDNSLDAGGNVPVTVKSIDNGWAFDGRSYSCEFYISEDAGRTIDFGKNSIEIDNRTTNGRTFLAKGYHVLATDKKNWKTIQPSEVTSPTSINPDVLYPYNHKYLIEGIAATLYGVDMTEDLGGITRINIVDPNDIYIPVERYWESTLKIVSAFDFTSNIDKNNFTVFSLMKDFGGLDRIAIKHNSDPGLLDDEKLAIITRVINSDLYEAIVLKAELTSEDSKVTPILDEYLVRLGY